jgi:hypothetical protein
LCKIIIMNCSTQQLRTEKSRHGTCRNLERFHQCQEVRFRQKVSKFGTLPWKPRSNCHPSRSGVLGPLRHGGRACACRGSRRRTSIRRPDDLRLRVTHAVRLPMHPRRRGTHGGRHSIDSRRRALWHSLSLFIQVWMHGNHHVVEISPRKDSPK